MSCTSGRILGCKDAVSIPGEEDLASVRSTKEEEGDGPGQCANKRCKHQIEVNEKTFDLVGKFDKARCETTRKGNAKWQSAAKQQVKRVTDEMYQMHRVPRTSTRLIRIHLLKGKSIDRKIEL